MADEAGLVPNGGCNGLAVYVRKSSFPQSSSSLKVPVASLDMTLLNYR